MKQHKNIDKNLKIIFELLDIDWKTTPENHKADFREAMRQIMSDSYIQGSHDCADSLLGGKR